MTLIPLLKMLVCLIPGSIQMGNDGDASDINAAKPADLERQIADHFMRITPELYRYAEVTHYGETWEAPKNSQDVIHEEARLLDGLIRNSQIDTKWGYALIHNLVVLDNVNAKDRLIQFSKHANLRDKESRKLFTTTLLAGGDDGETAAIEMTLSEDEELREFAGQFLSRYAIHSSTVTGIRSKYGSLQSDRIRMQMLYAVGNVCDNGAFSWVIDVAETSADDVQAAAFFAAAELARTEADLHQMLAVPACGTAAIKAKADGETWVKSVLEKRVPLQEKTMNDADFAKRFVGLECPTMNWIRLRPDFAVWNRSAPLRIEFTASAKREFIETLVRNKGFGLEAVKQDFAKSLLYTDIDSLLEIRRLGFFSPNEFSYSRQHTIDVIVRHMRHTGAGPTSQCVFESP